VTDHQWTELAAPYALGALDAAERARFEVHLAGCAQCRGEVQSLHDVTGLLAESAPAAAPPAALRARVLREAHRVRPIGARPPFRANIGPWLAAAACLVLAIGVGYAYLRERAAHGRAGVSLAALHDTIAARDSLVATLLSPDAATAALAATGQAPSARLFWSPSRRRVVMAVFHLTPAPAGRTYQLWAIAKGKPVSIGTFNTSPDGRLVAELPLPADLKFELTAVTEEPAGGSPQPTMQPFLIGKVTPAD
jgi:anti-sigma-K factor RskA